MISKKKVNPRASAKVYHDSSPDDRRSEKALSVKSGRSNTSQKSLSKTRNINRATHNTMRGQYGQNSQYSNLNNSNSKRITYKKSSVYDSDT